MGDPAGVGAEIICRSLAEMRPEERGRFVVFGDWRLMQRANALAGAGLHFNNAPGQSPGRPSVIDIQPPVPGSVHDGVMSAAAGARSYAYIDRAVSAALSGDIGVIVTAPINKEALHAAGYPFEGHTELLAHLTGTESSFMLLASDKLSTIHVS